MSGLADAEPVKFDWRYKVPEGKVSSQEPHSPSQWDAQPNPIVLPTPEAREQQDDTAGWHWLKPQVGSTPGLDSDRTAVRLANEAQEQDMARQQSPLNNLLPGGLTGLAPMAVESGVEWRF